MSNLTTARKIVFLKLCPRCNGDIHINSDVYGEYKECLQCGYMADIAKPSELSEVRRQVSGIGDVA